MTKMTASQEATRRGDPTIMDLSLVVGVLLASVPGDARLRSVTITPDSGEFQGTPGRLVVDVEWTT